jgi:hypothetical protein
MNRRAVGTTCLVMMLITGGPAAAQWLKIPLPGTPRTPDGKPNLTAPVPRTSDGKPDLSGIWRRNTPGRNYLVNIGAGGAELSMQPWAAALYKERQDSLSKDRPSGRCLPHGLPDAMMVSIFKIAPTPGAMLILYEEFVHFRQVFTDGRGFPNEANAAERTPTWFGYSIGKWEGDTFVADTIGFNDKSWLDDGGHPHSDAMHVTERFHRRDFGHMDIAITIDDPKAYTKPFTIDVAFALQPDTEFIEDICDNEKDQSHMVGK